MGEARIASRQKIEDRMTDQHYEVVQIRSMGSSRISRSDYVIPKVIGMVAAQAGLGVCRSWFVCRYPGLC
jgi:hypothetical protein